MTQPKLEKCLWKSVIKVKGKCIIEQCEGFNTNCEFYNSRFKLYGSDREILTDYEKLIDWRGK